MPKAYAQKDERFKVRLVSNGCTLDFQVDGSVTAGVAQLFAFLPADRRTILFETIEKKHKALLAREAERAAAQPNPSTNES